MGYGYHQPYGSSEDDDDGSCDYCGGDGCEECDDQFEEQLVQCRGITLRGTRCQITSDSMHGQRKFADAAEPLTCGSHYCTFHTDQEYERDECLECGGEGCPECCLECECEGCPECVGQGAPTGGAAEQVDVGTGRRVRALWNVRALREGRTA